MRITATCVALLSLPRTGEAIECPIVTSALGNVAIPDGNNVPDELCCNTLIAGLMPVLASSDELPMDWSVLEGVMGISECTISADVMAAIPNTECGGDAPTANIASSASAA